MKLSYAAVSDVGRVRKDNQDSAYAGPHLLVVADGVGGSARGDIASSTAVQELRRLDQPPADDMLSALAGAIHRSHDRIAELVAEDPQIEGTSTTVTAVIFDGGTIGVGHVGDSRGYLLRDGELSRLTHDHTFVQSLIDEGRITEQEARVHPHRNLILRAVDGVHEPEPDVFGLEAAAGDRLLLCSDGCSGSLDDAELVRILGEGTPDAAAVGLVSASLEAGSTDNVTVVVADVVADDAVAEESGDATGPVVVGAAAEQPERRGPGAAGGTTAPADTGELAAVDDEADEDIDPEELRYAPRPPRRFTWLRRLLFLLLALVLIGVVAFGAYRWTQDQYFVTNDGEQVVIYRGVQADIPGIALHHVSERSKLELRDLPPYNARQVRDGISASSLTDARGVVARLVRQVDCPAPEPKKPSAKASPKQSPKAGSKKSTSKKSSQKPSASKSTSPSPSPTRTPAVCEESR